jgi:hypothetical protein
MRASQKVGKGLSLPPASGRGEFPDDRVQRFPGGPAVASVAVALELPRLSRRFRRVPAARSWRHGGAHGRGCRIQVEPAAGPDGASAWRSRLAILAGRESVYTLGGSMVGRHGRAMLADLAEP